MKRKMFLPMISMVFFINILNASSSGCMNFFYTMFGKCRDSDVVIENDSADIDYIKKNCNNLKDKDISEINSAINSLKALSKFITGDDEKFDMHGVELVMLDPSCLVLLAKYVGVDNILSSHKEFCVLRHEAIAFAYTGERINKFSKIYGEKILNRDDLSYYAENLINAKNDEVSDVVQYILDSYDKIEPFRKMLRGEY